MVPVEGGRRVAVVTGASHGIGRALVARLVLSGFTVRALGRDAEALAAVVGQHPAGSVEPLVLDLASPSGDTFAQAVAVIVGPVHALVHTAGIIEPGPLLDTAATRALVSQVVTNAVAPLQLTQLLAPRMAPGGHVVFVNSSQGLRVEGDSGGYAASKHALRAIADGLRPELAPARVRVTSLYLGRTATPMQERLYAMRHQQYRPELLIQPESVADLVASILALPADVEVTDVTLRPSVRSY